MTTYNGETLTPRLADKVEEKNLYRLRSIKEKIKELSTEYRDIMSSFPLKQPIVNEIADGSYRTYIIDSPTGHFISYRELDLAMDTKTTKSDLKELSL